MLNEKIKKHTLFSLFLFWACPSLYPARAMQFSDSCANETRGSILDVETKRAKWV